MMERSWALVLTIACTRWQTWALNGSDGTTYELKDPPSELQQAGLKVRIDGQIREDVMTLAAIGPVLEVNSFEILN